MHDSCNGEWQVYGCEWALSGVWDQMNLIARIDMLLLTAVISTLRPPGFQPASLQAASSYSSTAWPWDG